jgi:hypothetical protein
MLGRPMSPKLILAAAAVFVAMFLMRMTLRTSQRRRPEGIRWRGIDWSRAKELEAGASGTAGPERAAPITGKSDRSASPGTDGSAGG